MPSTNQIKVQKRDGRIEPFMKEKLINGMVKAGATQEQAQSIADQIETWALGTAQNGIVKTSDIRTKLLELLGGVNPAAAAAFETYVKPKPPEQLVPGPSQTPPPSSPVPPTPPVSGPVPQTEPTPPPTPSLTPSGGTTEQRGGPQPTGPTSTPPLGGQTSPTPEV